jgi:hypothetical protein
MTILASKSDDSYLGAMIVNIFGAQVSDGIHSRAMNALDVSFNNFTAIADSIVVPEPMTMFLLGIGGLSLSRIKK